MHARSQLDATVTAARVPGPAGVPSSHQPEGALPAVLGQFQILDAVSQAVIATDADGVICFWNRAARELYGWDAEDVTGRSVLDITPAVEVHADAEALLARLRAGESWSGDMRLRRRDGTTFIAEITATPVLGGDGELVGVVGLSQDVTHRRAAEAANRYQAALLASLFDASIDGILAVDADGKVLAHNDRFLALWGIDRALVDGGDGALLAAARERVPDGDTFVAGVLSAYERRPFHIEDELRLVDGTVLERHGKRLDDERGEYLGFAWSFRDVTALRVQHEAAQLASERFAALARSFQQSLLPPTLPTVPGIDLAARYHPALEGVDVGGDFYDVFAVRDEWILVIGDVCGKGPEAASLTALVRHTIRAAAHHSSSPDAILVELNQALLASAPSGDQSTRFATVCCVRLRSSAQGVFADIACGGHPPPVVLRSDGSTAPGASYGTLIGVFDRIGVPVTSTELARGDSIVMVTDGVLEARGPDGELFERAGLVRILAGLAGEPCDAVAEAVGAAAIDQQVGSPRDDIAVLVACVSDLSGLSMPGVDDVEEPLHAEDHPGGPDGRHGVEGVVAPGDLGVRDGRLR